MLCVLWLGSSVGNLKPHEAVGFFQSVLQSAGPMTQVCSVNACIFFLGVVSFWLFFRSMRVTSKLAQPC